MPTFAINCPGCGASKEHMSPGAAQIGVHCSCGVTFTVDVNEQTVDDWWERESRSYVELNQQLAISVYCVG